MLLRNSQMLHPEFDLSEAARIYAAAGFNTDLSGEQITSPQCTKIGGLPYWPVDRPWPKNEEGTPYRFLAQFNFADSHDLFPKLPGQVLMILIDGGDDWFWEPKHIHFEWLQLGLTPCTTFARSLVAEKAGPFFGAIYRSADYPKASKKARESGLPQGYNLPILNGTKIGGLPHFIQSDDDVEGEFLCQLGSIQAAPYAPYPWVNESEPLGLEFNDRGIYGRENSIVFGDMGSIYIFRKEDGALTSVFECY
jgi:Domain of unknown function (DUF1963)